VSSTPTSLPRPNVDSATSSPATRKPLLNLAAWLEENVPEALTILLVPAAHRRRLCTTNGLERLNKEIKRRTWVATLFPSEAPS
jgi:transposase-like protein